MIYGKEEKTKVPTVMLFFSFTLEIQHYRGTLTIADCHRDR